MLIMFSIGCCGYNSYITSNNPNTPVANNPNNPNNPPNPANPNNPNNPPNPVNENTVQVYITFYGFNDNDNGSGKFSTNVIAYPKSDGNPTDHNVATEGTGTYQDPVTFATGINDINSGAFPVGGIIYIPFLQKYFMLEDQCAGCDKEKQGQQYHIDLYMGPSDHASDSKALYDCEGKYTGVAGIIMKPPPNLSVDTTTMFQNNQCTIVKHPVPPT